MAIYTHNLFKLPGQIPAIKLLCKHKVILTEINSDLREIRKSLNLSMQKFADELRVSKMFVYYIENGKRDVSIDTALRIQKFLKDKGINVKL